MCGSLFPFPAAWKGALRPRTSLTLRTWVLLTPCAQRLTPADPLRTLSVTQAKGLIPKQRHAARSSTPFSPQYGLVPPRLPNSARWRTAAGVTATDTFWVASSSQHRSQCGRRTGLRGLQLCTVEHEASVLSVRYRLAPWKALYRTWSGVEHHPAPILALQICEKAAEGEEAERTEIAAAAAASRRPSQASGWGSQSVWSDAGIRRSGRCVILRYVRSLTATGERFRRTLQ